MHQSGKKVNGHGQHAEAYIVPPADGGKWRAVAAQKDAKALPNAYLQSFLAHGKSTVDSSNGFIGAC